MTDNSLQVQISSAIAKLEASYPTCIIFGTNVNGHPAVVIKKPSPEVDLSTVPEFVNEIAVIVMG